MIQLDTKVPYLNQLINVYYEYKRPTEIILENDKTNISPIKMINLGFVALKINDKDIEKLHFPLVENRTQHIINKKKGWRFSGINNLI